MNFVNRHVAMDVASELASRALAPSLQPERKWPLRYSSIEAVAICTDLATILFAALLSASLYLIRGGDAATEIGKVVASAIVVTPLFVSLLKIHGKYRPTELLVFRDQVRAVCLAWTLAFLLLAGAVAALDFGKGSLHCADPISGLLGLPLLIAQRVAICASLIEQGRVGSLGGTLIACAAGAGAWGAALIATQHPLLPPPRTAVGGMLSAMWRLDVPVPVAARSDHDSR